MFDAQPTEGPWRQSPPLRVLHVLEAAREGGGTGRHLIDVVRCTPGVEHHVVVPPSGGLRPAGGMRFDTAAIDRLHDAGAVLQLVPMRRSTTSATNALAVLHIAGLIRRLHPEVVHGHSAVGGAVARLAAALTGVPALYTPNGLPSGRAAMSLERVLGKLTTRLIAVSDSEAQLASSWRLVAPPRLVVIPNGIDLRPDPIEAPDLRQKLGLAAGTPLVGSVGRLVPQKSPERFVEVCASVAKVRPDAHFLLIGMGPLQGALDDDVERAGLRGSFHQIPHLPRAASALGQLDVFVLVSRFEGAPYAPLEAMRAGVPVVLSDVVGNRDAVEHGVSGLLLPWGDTEAMAAGVVRLLHGGPERDALVAAAAKRLQERFDVRQMGAALQALYCEVTRAGTKGPNRPLDEAP